MRCFIRGVLLGILFFLCTSFSFSSLFADDQDLIKNTFLKNRNQLSAKNSIALPNRADCLQQYNDCFEGYPESTLIKTIFGYVPIESLRIDDKLEGINGEQEIVRIKKFKKDGIYHYGLTTEHHGFYIYPNEFVHNMDFAYITAAGGIGFGIIEVLNPVMVLVGALIPLTIYAVDCCMNKQVKFSLDLKEVLQDEDVVKETKAYYEIKRNELAKLHQELLQLKNNLHMFVRSSYKNAVSFSSNTLSVFQYQAYQYSLLPALSIEQRYCAADKERLLLLRDQELQKLEAEIFDIAVVLGLHVDELIERKDCAVDHLHEVEKEVNQDVDLWNLNLENLSYDIALDHYKVHFLWQESLNDLELRLNELKLVHMFYEKNKNHFFVSRVINIVDVLVNQAVINEKLFDEIKRARNIFSLNMQITEDFLNRHGLLSLELINQYRSIAQKNIVENNQSTVTQVKNKKESMKEKQKEVLQKDKKSCFGGPDKDPDDDEPSGVVGYFVNALKHIFRDEIGHLKDNPENRKLLLDMASKAKNRLGVDMYGNVWYGKILRNGRQLWAWVRDNLIRDGGINEAPRVFNERTGLCRPIFPKK